MKVDAETPHVIPPCQVAKDAITHKDCRTAMVMEGYTDALIAQQFGFHNAIACLGTALGERHIKILKRFADTILLVLDGDELKLNSIAIDGSPLGRAARRLRGR